MSTPWAGKTGIGFAIVSTLTATVALTTTAAGNGLDTPTSGVTCATISALPFFDTGDTTGLDFYTLDVPTGGAIVTVQMTAEFTPYPCPPRYNPAFTCPRSSIG